MKFTFHGGIHPQETKDATEHKPIETPPLPERVYIPMSQHIGAPSKPVVKKGDMVKTGTLIGEPTGRVSVPTHASVSGIVADVVELAHPLSGRRILTCIIDSDGKDAPDGSIRERDCSNLAPQQIIEIIKAAGIAGMGGATFPTFFKLSPPKEKPIDTLIINGCECEPYLTADHRLMLEKPEQIIDGTRFLAQALGVRNIIIAIEDNKPDAIKAMSESAKKTDFKVRPFKTKYPQGAEKQLIRSCLKREVPSGGLPMDVGCVVQNVGTTKAVHDAVRFGKPLYERITTVTGPGVKEPKNLCVRIGTPVKNLIEICGGYHNQTAKLIMGGPMMGITISSDQAPVLKGSSGILVLDSLSAIELEDHDCIRCGRCIKACPMGLLPQDLYNHIKAGRLNAAEKEHVLDCIECGCCAFVCPAKIRLVHHFKYAKSEIMARRKK